jgi:hypothetical protein
MFTNEDLENELKYSHTIDNHQAVWAEWNINAAYNVDKVGNYRHRPGSTDPQYAIISPTYDPSDSGNNYTGATDSDTIISAGFDDADQPAFLITPKKKINLLYSLEDCLKPNRPRSGINKILYLGDNQYIDGLTSGISNSVDVSRRPRYYMASRYDAFKYWTSYRTQTVDGISQEFGVALNQSTGGGNPSYYIYDAAPFVVYKDIVPTNKIVVKMQTNVGEVDNGPFRFGGSTNVPDPLYGLANRTVPRRWAIQGLDTENNWVELISFTESQTRPNGDPIIASDGVVEIEYGLNVPNGYEDIFTLVGEVYSTSLIPDLAPNGYAYLYKSDENDIGVLYVSDGSNWITFTPDYSWSLASADVTKTTKVLKSFVNPEYFIHSGNRVYRELQFIKGIRIVVETMNKRGCTFDLIEMSPRIVADITNNVIGFSVTKVLSDLGSYSIPTGSLLASTGSLELFDEDNAFNHNNTFDYNTNSGSVISDYLDIKIRFTLYDIVKNIGNYDYYIPVKSLYSEKIPQTSDSKGTLSFELRDLYYMLESSIAPEMLLTNVSLSYAITVLLDSIGFSNYSFKRIDGEDELIIPFFFVSPQQNVAEVLQQLAMSSHSAMFFDEYNNFVVMSKNYLLPSETDRSTDLTLYGQEVFDGTGTALPNMINMSSQDKKVFNGGEINYTTRYIQRSIGSISQAPYIDEYKSYVYKPVLLWEVAGQESTKTINASTAQSSGYSLSAIPLKTDLSSSVPTFSGGELINNVIDLGEGVYWLGNYSGYFYSGGEIIKFDAVEYSVAGLGTVWITNNQQYQDYFSRLPFNGKIYPTGRVRIYTNIDGSEIKEHGRGQFGTEIVSHNAGIPENSDWVVDENVRGVIQNARSYLFNTNQKILYPTSTGIEEAGSTKVLNGETYTSQSSAIRSTRNGIIKNFLANTNITELETNYYKSALSGSVQSSALVFNGPDIPSDINPADFVTYQYKTLDKPYKHFGTRMRIIGKIESGTNTDQQPIGLFDIYSGDLASTDPTKQVSISGGGGGIAFNLNKETNIGYYFEIDALSQNSISSYSSKSNAALYTIVNSPVIQVSNNVVTITLSEQHDFEVGDKVTVAGVVDDNRKTSPTAINGEYSVTAISTDRKQFTYSITPITTTAAISAASSNGTEIVYVSSAHNFVAGNIVAITGFTSTAYNITGVISSVGTNSSGVRTFTISTAITAGSATGTGTATYQNLTTLSSTGGTASKSVDEDALISNVFLYKLVSGYNEADIIKKQLTSNVATLTTLRKHDLQVDEQITVSGVDATFNGTYKITAITDNTFSYAKTATNVSLTDVSPIGLARSNNRIAIPKILWRGFSEVIVDDGKFTGQSRMTGTDKPTVYDMSVEYLNVGTTRQFYLYLNDKQIATVTDLDPLPLYNNIALFVRGSSRCMFENVFALSDNFSENSARALQIPISQAFGDEQLTESQALNRYALSGIVQNTYLSGISSQSVPLYDMYYEEFGSIMRESAYFNIKYDKAYPALYATLAKTLNRAKGYTVSGFFAGSYGAEFLIFNAIDKNLNLDDTSGNYLRILGIAFTQDTTHSLGVDDFFKKNSNFINDYYSGSGVSSEYKQLYTDIVASRSRYGRNDFSIQAEYLQTDAAAEAMMDWTVRRAAYPRTTIGVNVFAVPHLQLGDIVTINYVDESGQYPVAPPTKRFVVYNIQYQKGNGQFANTVHLAEV